MMPSKSKAQHNFMEAIAHSPSFAKKVGVPQKVGQDFSNADKGRKFSKGGDTMATKMMKKMAAGGKSGGTSGGGGTVGSGGGGYPMKKGGMTASAMGKVKTAAPSRDGLAVKGKTRGTNIKMAGSGVPKGIGARVMNKGGMAKC
jgi:hypothetical protein